MIVLDTSVVAELVRGPRAEPAVIGWVRSLTEQPVTTVVNRAELLAGVALLAPGTRRTSLATAIEDMLAEGSSCLPFDDDCPAAYARVVATRAQAGVRLPTRVAMVAAVALVNGAGVATRDPASYDGLGLRVVDPWACG